MFESMKRRVNLKKHDFLSHPFSCSPRTVLASSPILQKLEIYVQESYVLSQCAFAKCVIFGDQVNECTLKKKLKPVY